jgi:uncharacterized glyoxalase superfamily protein PhnB
MIINRSVPTNTILPHVTYQDVAEALAWLTRVFGFVEHYRYGDPIGGAQMFAGSACIMLNDLRGKQTPRQLGFGTQSLTIFVEDVEEYYARARAEGATIVEELHETVYGELQYGVEDLDGHHWLFSRHAQDLAPEDWGATVADITGQTSSDRHANRARETL